MKTQYAHYDLELLLSRGGMGEVWLARDTRDGATEENAEGNTITLAMMSTSTGKSLPEVPPEVPGTERVALKIPLGEGAAPTEEILRRFAREVEVMRNLDHPGIVRHVDSSPRGDHPYLALEFIDGTPLREIEKRATLQGLRLPLGQVASVARQLAEVLAYLHTEAGLIHRDLKPENIMLTDEGQVKVIDFGIALRPDQTRLTHRSEWLGSPQFLAPEQIKSPQRISWATDVYAFGLVVYEMLTGLLPHSEHYKPARGFHKGLPRQWDAMLQLCLNPDPEQRLPNGAELLKVVQRLSSPQSPPVAIQSHSMGSGRVFKDAVPRESKKPNPSGAYPDGAPRVDPFTTVAASGRSRLRWVFAGCLLVAVFSGWRVGGAIWSGPVPGKAFNPIAIPTPPPSTDRNAPASFNDVVKLLRREDWIGAETLLAKMVEQKPREEGIRVNLALLYAQEGKKSLAEQTLREGLRLNPQSPRLNLSLKLMK